MVDNVLHEEQPSEQGAQNVLVLNDDNNNSNDNFGGPDMGPETDVDAIEEEFQANAAAAAVACEKEKTQMEFKETEDVADRVDIMNFVDDHSAAIYGSLENKIFEEMSLQNPDMMKGSNPFASSDDAETAEIIAEAIAPATEFFDNKIMDEQIEQRIEDFADKLGDLTSDEAFGVTMESVADSFEKELTSANEEVAFEEQQQQPEAGETLKFRLTGIFHKKISLLLNLANATETMSRDPILYSSVKRAFELQTLFFGNGLALMAESLFALKNT